MARTQAAAASGIGIGYEREREREAIKMSVGPSNMGQRGI